MPNFGFKQGDDGAIQFAHITVPSCGRRERDDAPMILIEIDKAKGTIALNVYGDIQSSEPTHIIQLDDAKLSRKKVEPVTEEKPLPQEAE